MTRSFRLNGLLWRVRFVSPHSEYLIDRTSTFRVATTDPIARTIYLSDRLQGVFLRRVLLHELGHATMFSYDLLGYIHDRVPKEYWIDVEEWICNFLADYGDQIFYSASDILGYDAWRFVPKELNRLFG